MRSILELDNREEEDQAILEQSLILTHNLMESEKQSEKRLITDQNTIL